MFAYQVQNAFYAGVFSVVYCGLILLMQGVKGAVASKLNRNYRTVKTIFIWQFMPRSSV